MNANNNISTNSTIADITTLGASKGGYKPELLPEVAYFRVQSRGAVGTYRTGLKARSVGWALLVSCKDGKGLRLVTDVAYEYGMKAKGEFKTKEEAIAAGIDYIAKWGKAKVVKAKTAKAKGPTKEELAKQLAEARAMIAEMKGETKSESEKQEELAGLAAAS